MKAQAAVTATTIDAARLLEEIDAGRIALPDFQRDFDWEEKDVAALLVTVLSGWPAGSLLVLRGRTKAFHIRKLDGGPELANVDRVVLDGQQRLTSLYQALYDRGKHIYTISFRHQSSMFDLEDAITWFDRATWDRQYREPREQLEKGLIPLYALKSASDFFEWREEVVAQAPRERQGEIKDQLSTLYRDVLSNVHRYEFPVVSIDEDIEPAALARIFERVNKHGQTLGAFDLMVAKLYDPQWNLRERWETATREAPVVDYFLANDGLPVLQVLALRYQGDVRQRAVTDLPRELVHEKWDAAVEAVEFAVRFVVDCCGVGAREWLPYKGMILPLAALQLGGRFDENVSIRWFWHRAFATFFDAAANTRLVSDFYNLLERDLRALGLEPVALAPVRLEDATRKRQASIWAAFLCSLKVRGAEDLASGEGFLYPADLVRHRAEKGSGRPTVVSVFPRPTDDTTEAAPLHLRVLGMVLAHPETARLIRRLGFAEMCRRAVETHGIERVQELLARQLLPAFEQLDLIEEAPADFLRVRRLHLATMLEERWDLILDEVEVPPI